MHNYYDIDDLYISLAPNKDENDFKPQWLYDKGKRPDVSVE